MQLNILSEATRQGIDGWLAKFPANQRQSAVIPALKLAQIQNKGWLDEKIMNAVADYLQIPYIAVFEVASFYTLFHLKPVGKHCVYLCTNISCQLRGSAEVAEKIQSCLGINFGETTKDNKFSLYEVECLGACGGAPAMQIGMEYRENLTPENVEAILAAVE